MRLIVFGAGMLAATLSVAGQAVPQPGAPGQQNSSPGTANTAPPPGTAVQGAPGVAPGPSQALSLDLSGALQRARDYNQQFLQAGFGVALSREARVQARAAQLPTLNLQNQMIYTEGNGTPSGVFVSNDGVHVYNEQATVHAEVFNLVTRAEYARARAAEATAQARLDIALRGLVATVITNYYSLITAQRHVANARRSLDEAAQFLDLTRKQERGGEVAKADVIKAQLQYQQRQRDLVDADTNVQRARLALGVILFVNQQQPFSVIDDLHPETPLPPFDEISGLALSSSPEVRAARSGIREAAAGFTAAKAAYLPFLAVDYFYGINANVFSVRGPEDRQNLGSVVQGTLTVPVWNWGATRSRVRQAQIVQQQAQAELTLAQRALQVNLSTFYLEAQTARGQLQSLRSSLDLSTESLRLTILRYQAGEASALEVVDAQTTLATARNAHDDGLARYRVALASLQTLTGRF